MPDWIRGFLADKSSRTASRTAPELGAWGWRLGDWYENDAAGTSCVPTSLGTSTMTGPGRPLRRRWKARRRTAATMSGFQMTSPDTDTVW